MDNLKKLRKIAAGMPAVQLSLLIRFAEFLLVEYPPGRKETP